MNNSKWLVLTMAAGLAAGGLIGFNSQAAEGDAPHAPMLARVLERVKEKLDLTDDQIAKIKAELKAEKDMLKNEVSKLHAAKIAVRTAIQASDATESSVRAASAKAAAEEVDLALELFKLHGKISPILTAEQRDKVKEFQGRIDGFIEGIINRVGEHLTE